MLSSPHPPALSFQGGASHLRPCSAPGGVDLYCSPGSSPLTSFLDTCGLLSGPQPQSQAEAEAVSPGLWPPRKGSLGLKVEGAGPADPQERVKEDTGQGLEQQACSLQSALL